MKSTALQKDFVAPSEPWKMLTWLLFAQILTAFVGRSLAPLGVLIGQDLSLSMAQIGMLPAALFLGQSFVSLPAGFWVDKVGSRKLLLLVTMCLGCSFILLSISATFWIVLVVIAIGGLGYGGMHPTTNRGIIYWFPLKQRGTAMGIKQMGVTLGSALAAFMLLPLAYEYGWRPVLIGACLLLIVVGILAYYFYHDPLTEKTTQTTTQTSHFFSSIKELFQNKPLLIVSLSAMGLNGSQMCLNTYIVLFAYEKIGIGLLLSGSLLVISEISGSIGRIAWGLISDRIFQGRRVIVLVIISILTGLSSMTIALIPVGSSYYLLVPIIIFFGFSISGFNGIWMNVATELVPREQSGMASGLSLTIGSLGVIIVAPVFGVIIDQTGSFSAGWTFLACIMLGVITLLLLSLKMVKQLKI